MSMFPSGNSNCLTKKKKNAFKGAHSGWGSQTCKQKYKYCTYNVKLTDEISINLGEKKI